MFDIIKLCVLPSVTFIKADSDFSATAVTVLILVQYLVQWLSDFKFRGNQSDTNTDRYPEQEKVRLVHP